MSFENNRNCERLVLLVGSNPLPNYISAIVLKPQSVQLMYTEQTKSIKNGLKAALKKQFPALIVKDSYIGKDGSNAHEVEKVWRRIRPDAHVNYTGGTKIMASHSRMAFRDIGGKDARASYLDERNDALRFDDGDEVDLAEAGVEISLEEILSLHRISKRPSDKERPTVSKSMSIAASVLKNEEPNSNSDGFWLEVWAGEKIKEVLGEKPVVGLNCLRENGREFEVDVVLVRGHRLYVISCTKKKQLSECKQKLFEVAIRARHLGGDLARSALVCLLDGGDNKGPYVDQLRNDIADIWGATNTPEAFGLDDLKEWEGVNGKPKLNTLRDWLES